jgi:hypothetical protein
LTWYQRLLLASASGIAYMALGFGLFATFHRPPAINTARFATRSELPLSRGSLSQVANAVIRADLASAGQILVSDVVTSEKITPDEGIVTQDVRWTSPLGGPGSGAEITLRFVRSMWFPTATSFARLPKS